MPLKLKTLTMLVLTSLLLSCIFVSNSNAQAVEQSATYVSQVDQDLTLRRVAVLPVGDNVDGIYARQIEAQLTQLVKDSHRWDYTESNISGSLPSVGELEEKPATVQQVLRSVNADAVFVAAASKGPNGLSIRLDLFLKKDGRLLAQDLLKDHPRFEIAEVKEQVKLMYRKVVGKLPYQGLILSRQNNRVTINLGKSDGLQKEQIVSAVQIISVNRHPKFGFLISSEKEILGRIKILKVDDTLSFGAIISEKERGAIGRLAKISALEDVNYGEPSGLSPDTDKDIRDRTDADVSFGKNAKEWVPVAPPSFGQVGLTVGLGSYNSSVNLQNVANCCEANASIYPSVTLSGELWLNPEWIVRLDMTQGVLSTDNPREGSSPGDINHSYSRYSLAVGYNFLLQDDFFGPKIQVNAGFGTTRMYADDSQPRAFTTTTFTGTLVGLSGIFPVTEDKIWFAGGKFNLFLFPKLSETPVSSGASADAGINDFSLFVQKKIGANLRATGSIDVSLYSANFSGTGTRTDGGGNPEVATSLSQRHTVLNAGVIYMF